MVCATEFIFIFGREVYSSVVARRVGDVACDAYSNRDRRSWCYTAVNGYVMIVAAIYHPRHGLWGQILFGLLRYVILLGQTVQEIRSFLYLSLLVNNTAP
ncbi:hypothetical protein [Anaplasma platys]|uniref:hypothetical protein n=1 Tax=Anaplasma platys TaxID=949 RepID=UPI00145DE69B|nr:hypothetical protein [Anaplasma platys]